MSDGLVVVVGSGQRADGFIQGCRQIDGHRVGGDGDLLQAQSGDVFGACAKRTMRIAARDRADEASAAFALSRTVGLFGFTETGWEPEPYALLSVAAEALVAILVGDFEVTDEDVVPQASERLA
jgi:hypothetical protein